MTSLETVLHRDIEIDDMKMIHPSRILYAGLGATVTAFGIARSAHADHIITSDLQTEIETRTGLGETSPVDTTTEILSIILGILALVAVALIIYAGFSWMFSGGNEEKVTQAKGILRSAIIGLLIILAAWGITIYVIDIIAGVTGTSTT
jgi:hypothetical protein